MVSVGLSSADAKVAKWARKTCPEFVPDSTNWIELSRVPWTIDRNGLPEAILDPEPGFESW